MNNNFDNLHQGLQYAPNNILINGMFLFYFTNNNRRTIHMIVSDIPLTEEQIESLRSRGITNLIRMTRRDYDRFSLSNYHNFTRNIQHVLGTIRDNISILNVVYVFIVFKNIFFLAKI
jgi:hypothetical protein